MTTADQRHQRGQVRMRVILDLETSMDPGFAEQWFHTKMRHDVGSPTWSGRNSGNDKLTGIAIIVEPSTESTEIATGNLDNIARAQEFITYVDVQVEGTEPGGSHIIRSVN